MSASLTCRCGGVSILFQHRTPFLSIIDGCSDCAATASWASATLRAPPFIHSLRTIIYLKDDLSVSRGVENLVVVRMRKESATQRVYARCCGSALFGSHPLYAGRGVVVLKESCSVMGFDEVPVTGAVFYDDIEGAHEIIQAAGYDPRLCITSTVPTSDNNDAMEKFKYLSAYFGEANREKVLGSALDAIKNAEVFVIR